MSTLPERGFEIYRNEGLGSLLRKGTRYALDRTLALILGAPIIDRVCYRLSVKRLQQRMDAEENLDDILDTAFNYQGYGRYQSIEPLQIREEFTELANIVTEQEPTTVMEIGTANGGTFYTWCRHLNVASTILSLDLPGGDFGGGYSREKTQFFEQFAPEKDLVFIRDDSHSDRTLQEVKDAIPEGGVDFLLIDGDHRYEGVKQDFEMYSQLVADGGLIAFHDIVNHPDGQDCEVDKFWDEIKHEYESEEITFSSNQNWGGIGILYL